MTRVQFSLVRLLVAVIILAAACAALTCELALVASAVLTLQYALLAFGIIGIVARRGADRLFWVGFVVFGLVYRHAAYSIDDARALSQGRLSTSEDVIITDWFLQLAFKHRRSAPRIGSLVNGEWTPGNYYPATVTQVADDGSMLLTWLDGSVPKWVKPSGVRGNWRSFRSTGHSVFTILAGLIGGDLGVLFFPTSSNEDQPTQLQGRALRASAGDRECAGEAREQPDQQPAVRNRPNVPRPLVPHGD